MFVSKDYVSLLELMHIALKCENTFDDCIKMATTGTGVHTPDHPGFFDCLEARVFILANHIGVWANSVEGKLLKIPVAIPHKMLPKQCELRGSEMLTSAESVALFERGSKAFGFEPYVHHRLLIEHDARRSTPVVNKHPSEMWCFKSVAAYHERGSYTVDTTWAKFLETSGYFSSDFQFLPSLAQIEGYSLCVERKRAQDFWEEAFGEPMDDPSARELMDVLQVQKIDSQAEMAWKRNASNETKARKVGRGILEAEEEPTLRKWQLLLMINEKLDKPLGTKASDRVIAYLREDFPHISRSGAPKRGRD